jgi:hypothetical protein
MAYWVSCVVEIVVAAMHHAIGCDEDFGCSASHFLQFVAAAAVFPFILSKQLSIVRAKEFLCAKVDASSFGDFSDFWFELVAARMHNEVETDVESGIEQHAYSSDGVVNIHCGRVKACANIGVRCVAVEALRRDFANEFHYVELQVCKQIEVEVGTDVVDDEKEVFVNRWFTALEGNGQVIARVDAVDRAHPFLARHVPARAGLSVEIVDAVGAFQVAGKGQKRRDVIVFRRYSYFWQCIHVDESLYFCDREVVDLKYFNAVLPSAERNEGFVYRVLEREGGDYQCSGFDLQQAFRRMNRYALESCAV